MIEYQVKQPEAAEGYHQPILNAAPDFQSQNTYPIQGTSYGTEANTSQSQGVRYQNQSNQQASVPLDVCDSKCPTQGHCDVCHRLCMVRK